MPAVADKRRVVLGPDGRPLTRMDYDAVEAGKRRTVPLSSLKSEDEHLPPEKRRMMVSTARDLQRNFVLAAWAIRKHLDYVSTFSFQAKTGVPEFDDSLEALIRWWSRAKNIDAAARHPLRRMIRMAEERRTVDGDVFLMKLADGRIQAVEGDRVKNPLIGLPASIDLKRLVQGVLTDEAGAAVAYAVNRRGSIGMMEFERFVPAENMIHHAYWGRFDQIRGISPLAPAINTYRDMYEGMDYALAKLKVAQLFGLVFYRENAEAVGITTESAESTDDSPKYDVDLGKGPVKLELEPGDRAEWLESKTPAGETIAYLDKVLGMALKALDLPYSFNDESFTNFFGSRAALNHYLQSAYSKRADNQDVLDHLTMWRVRMWIDDGVLTVPSKARLAWDWIPKGLPWWNPAQEVNADVQSIAAGLNSRTRVCRERGEDVYEIIDEIAEENAYLTEKGLPVNVAPANVQIVEIGGEK
ncbi:MAG TPA: phage portal protein [Phycisphaerae bacterium]|nr:phage portal protein [Phycisphaerae bacterium]